MGNTIYKSVFGDYEVRVLMLGLDAAGKTTILYKLKLGKVVNVVPTMGFNIETINHKDYSIEAWDVGSRDKSRPLLRHYYPNTDALVFVIDSRDKERYEEAVGDYLKESSQEGDLDGIPFLILANKQDCDDIMTADDITDDIEKRNYLRGRQWKVFGVCAKTGSGLYEGLDWLTEKLAHMQYKKGCLRQFMQYPSIQKTSNQDSSDNQSQVPGSKPNMNPSVSYYSLFLHSFKSLFRYGK